MVCCPFSKVDKMAILNTIMYFLTIILCSLMSFGLFMMIVWFIRDDFIKKKESERKANDKDPKNS